MPGTAVIGRDEELRSIEAFLLGVPEGPRALVLSGEPGIGKTVLWEAAVAEARLRVGSVLAHRSVAAEAGLAFTGLSDLVAPVADEVASSLAPPRRRALEVALLLAEPGEEAPDPRAIGLALLDVLRTLAERGPVIVALDDVQWLDSSTLGVLGMALRRLRDEPVGLLATLRKVPEIAASFELERAFTEEQLERLWLAPLSLGALHRVLRERLGLDLTRPEVARVLETSAGNPFFALELGRELVRTGARPSPGQALRVPASLHDLLGGRLARLPGETADVLVHCAALARPTFELLAAALNERPEIVRAALGPALKEGVVEPDGAFIRFTHPLLASICYERAPAEERRVAHQALAEAVTDIEERARHLALAAEGADDAVAAELDVAAEEAAARGATAASAELSELAAARTASDSSRARRRLLRAADLHRLSGNSDRATTILERLLAEVPSGGERADILYVLVMTLRPETPRLMELGDEILAEAGTDEERRSRMLALRSGLFLLRGDLEAAREDARLALESAERTTAGVLLAAAIARVGQVETYSADVTPGLLERGAEIEQRLGVTLEYQDSPRYALARLQMRLGQLESARALLEEAQAKAAARGDEGSRASALSVLSMLDWLAGHWPRALDQAMRAHELVEQIGHAHARLWLGRGKALVEADLGLVDDARLSAERGLAFARSNANEFYVVVTRGVLGRLELGLANLEAAEAHLRELPGWLLARGLNDPTLPVWADAIETLVLVGDSELARAYLEPYEQNARRLGSPWALAVAARCRGLLFAVDGELQLALDAFDRALTQLEAHPYPLEQARTLLCLGQVRRQAQQRKAAREALARSLAIFEGLGAPLWSEKARAELKRISGRPPTSDALTETELRVAVLASRGRSNREISAELFMGISTVERHLSHAYRKFGVRSRADLGPCLAAQGSEAPKAKDATTHT